MNRITLFARSSNENRVEEQLARCRHIASSKGLPCEGASVLKDTCPRAADLIKAKTFGHVDQCSATEYSFPVQET